MKCFYILTAIALLSCSWLFIRPISSSFYLHFYWRSIIICFWFCNIDNVLNYFCFNSSCSKSNYFFSFSSFYNFCFKKFISSRNYWSSEFVNFSSFLLLFIIYFGILIRKSEWTSVFLLSTSSSFIISVSLVIVF